MRHISNRSQRIISFISWPLLLVPAYFCVSACKNPKVFGPEATTPMASYTSSSIHSNVNLTDTYWKLIELNSQPVSTGAGKKELHMVFNTENSRVAGFSGCNRFTGGYKMKGNQIEFSHMASTRMACMESMDQEQHFLSALGNTKQFKINGEKLFMYDADGKLLFRFETVHLK